MLWPPSVPATTHRPQSAGQDVQLSLPLHAPLPQLLLSSESFSESAGACCSAPAQPATSVLSKVRQTIRRMRGVLHGGRQALCSAITQTCGEIDRGTIPQPQRILVGLVTTQCVFVPYAVAPDRRQGRYRFGRAMS